MLDGVIFLVGLDRHRRLAELRQAALLHRDILLERGARVLLPASRSLAAATCCARRFEPRFERELVLGLGRELLARGVGGAIERLQGDESFQVGVHGSRFAEAPKKRPRRSGA